MPNSIFAPFPILVALHTFTSPNGKHVSNNSESFVDCSSMGSREQSDAADSTFSHLEGLGSAGIGRRLLADSTVVYLSAIGRWGLESSWKLQVRCSP